MWSHFLQKVFNFSSHIIFILGLWTLIWTLNWTYGKVGVKTKEFYAQLFKKHSWTSFSKKITYAKGFNNEWKFQFTTSFVKMGTSVQNTFHPNLMLQFNLTHTHMFVSIHVFSSNPQNKYGKEIRSQIIYPIVQNWYFEYLWILGMKIHTIWNI